MAQRTASIAEQAGLEEETKSSSCDRDKGEQAAAALVSCLSVEAQVRV